MAVGSCPSSAKFTKLGRWGGMGGVFGRGKTQQRRRQVPQQWSRDICAVSVDHPAWRPSPCSERDTGGARWPGASGLKDAAVVRLPGELTGERVELENLEGCTVFLLDACDSVVLDGVRQTRILIFLRDCEGCWLAGACGQLRTLRCCDLSLLLLCPTQPSLDTSDTIRVGCFRWERGTGPLLSRAGLSPLLNKWWDVFDFTPAAGHFSLLGPAESVADQIPSLPPEAVSSLQALADACNGNCVVPPCWGLRGLPDGWVDGAVVFMPGASVQALALAVRLGPMAGLPDEGFTVPLLIRSSEQVLSAQKAQEVFGLLRLPHRERKAVLLLLQSAPSIVMHVGQSPQGPTVQDMCGGAPGVYVARTPEDARAVVDSVFDRPFFGMEER